MPEQHNERSDSHEVTDITPGSGNTPRRGNNEATYPTPMHGNNEETYPTPIQGNNEATFVTPMQSGNNAMTHIAPVRGNNESTFIPPMQGNNEVTYLTPMQGNNESTPMSGNNEVTYIAPEGNSEATYVTPIQGDNNEVTYPAPARENNEKTYIAPPESQNEHIDLITTGPLPVVPAPSTPPGQNIDRRKLLLGGSAALLALVGGGTALSMALSNSGQQRTSGSTRPTVVPESRAVVPGTNVLTIAAHNDAVTNVLWDPTGRYLASSSFDNSIKLWDVGHMLQQQATNPLTLSQPSWALHFNNPADLSFDTLHWSADGRKLVTLAPDPNNNSRPTLLSPFTGDTKGQIFTDTTLKSNSLVFTSPAPAPRGTTLVAIDAIARHYHKVDLWQMSKPNAPQFSLTYQDPNQFIGDFVMLHIISWSCDGTLLAALFSSQLSMTRSIVVWDVKTRAVKAAFQLAGLNEDMDVFRATLSWSPFDPHVLAVFNLNTIAVIDASQGKILYQLSTDDPDASQPVSPNKGHIPLVLAITWSPDGRYIAASYASSNKIYLWDTQDIHAPTSDGARLQHLIFPPATNDPHAHSDSISDLSWSPNGRFLVSASFDKSIKVWKVDK